MRSSLARMLVEEFGNLNVRLILADLLVIALPRLSFCRASHRDLSSGRRRDRPSHFGVWPLDHNWSGLCPEEITDWCGLHYQRATISRSFRRHKDRRPCKYWPPQRLCDRSPRGWPARFPRWHQYRAPHRRRRWLLDCGKIHNIAGRHHRTVQRCRQRRLGSRRCSKQCARRRGPCAVDQEADASRSGRRRRRRVRLNSTSARSVRSCGNAAGNSGAGARATEGLRKMRPRA